MLVYEDSRVIPGTRYGYRLGIWHEGAEELLGEAWVEVLDELLVRLDEPVAEVVAAAAVPWWR